MPNDQNIVISENLPQELLMYIFSFLTPKELAIISSVSNYWNQLANDNALWQLKCQAEGVNLESSNDSYKQAYIRHTQTSYYLCFLQVNRPLLLDSSSWNIQISHLSDKNRFSLDYYFYENKNLKEVSKHYMDRHFGINSNHFICKAIKQKDGKLSVISYIDLYSDVTYQPQPLDIKLKNTIKIFNNNDANISQINLAKALKLLKQTISITQNIDKIELGIRNQKKIQPYALFSTKSHIHLLKPLTELTDLVYRLPNANNSYQRKSIEILEKINQIFNLFINLTEKIIQTLGNENIFNEEKISILLKQLKLILTFEEKIPEKSIIKNIFSFFTNSQENIYSELLKRISNLYDEIFTGLKILLEKQITDMLRKENKYNEENNNNETSNFSMRN